MRKMLKNKKKKGFTLIEMVAVVAIIGILAAILVPKITGYINEAKKTAVIDQARKVSQAYESAVMKGTTKVGANTLSGTTLIKDALDETANQGNTSMKSLVDRADLSGLGITLAAGAIPAGTNSGTLNINHCLAITKGSDFEVTKQNGVEVVTITSIDTSFASK